MESNAYKYHYYLTQMQNINVKIGTSEISKTNYAEIEKPSLMRNNYI